MSFIEKFLGSGNRNEENQAMVSGSESAAAVQDPNNGVHDEIVAAIMAAIACAMGPGASSGIVVRSIRRLGATAPVWCVAGRQSCIDSRI